MPFSLRQKTLDKLRTRSKKFKSSDANKTAEIIVGSQVCLKSSPIYNAGATGFTVCDGIPRVGQLMEAVWALSDTCRFKLKTTHSNRYLNYYHFYLRFLRKNRILKGSKHYICLFILNP